MQHININRFFLRAKIYSHLDFQLGLDHSSTTLNFNPDICFSTQAAFNVIKADAKT